MRSRVQKRKTVNALSVRQSDQWLATALPWLFHAESQGDIRLRQLGSSDGSPVGAPSK